MHCVVTGKCGRCCKNPVFLCLLVVQGIETEEKLVEIMTYNNDTVNNEITYLAGVVFENPTTYESKIPFNISYTIR